VVVEENFKKYIKICLILVYNCYILANFKGVDFSVNLYYIDVLQSNAIFCSFIRSTNTGEIKMSKVICLLVLLSCVSVHSALAIENVKNQGARVLTATAVLASPMSGILKVDEHGVEKKVNASFLLLLSLVFVVAGFVGYYFKNFYLSCIIGSVGGIYLFSNYFSMNTSAVLVVSAVCSIIGALSVYGFKSLDKARENNDITVRQR